MPILVKPSRCADAITMATISYLAAWSGRRWSSGCTPCSASALNLVSTPARSGTTSPLTFHDCKAIDEFLALAYWREKKLPTIIVRLFNTVGPRQTGQYGMVIPTFVKQALAGRPITVYGDGNQSRCFGYVGDVVGALVKLI